MEWNNDETGILTDYQEKTFVYDPS